MLKLRLFTDLQKHFLQSSLINEPYQHSELKAVV